ncbi:MAG: RIP metalloprotease RseP [Mariprofundaceae bacterium]|nr:RIP metalloprotease RseP [Mariprofundaceae bacterium]
MEGLYTLFTFILAIAILVAVHEYGHFIVARKLGIRVEKFSIGFGPALFSWRSKDQEVEYIIAAIPLGGYVKMLGEQGQDDQTLSESERARAYDVQAVWKRAAVAIAGPAYNFFFAIFIFMCIAWLGQQVLAPIVGKVMPSSTAEQIGLMTEDKVVAINDRHIYSWRTFEETLKQHVGQTIQLHIERDGSLIEFNVLLGSPEKDPLLTNVARDVFGVSLGKQVYLNSIQEDSVAQKSGLHKGDLILFVNGKTIDDNISFIQEIRTNVNQATTLSLQRDGNMLSIAIIPQADDNGMGRIGVSLQEKVTHPPIQHQFNFIDGLQYGFTRTWEMTVLTTEVLSKMVSSTISTDNLGGPIAIAQLARRSADMGLIPFLIFLAMISINLGVLNLLPVPILDGGHLVFLSLEAIRGKPLEQKIMEFSQVVGMMLIMALMFFAFYNDLLRLFGA